MTSASPDFRSAATLAAEVRRGAISAAELTEQAIARIEALDGPLNAVVVRDFERAREAARAIDRSRPAGDSRPLLGVPMTVKEAFDVAGLPTTWGFVANRDNRAAADAVAVERLKAAGAVILGKTNVPVALADWQSNNPIYGLTRNPWDLGRSPGGSSGGSAAVLAAGMVPLEIGSDIGGSIRVPAHFCGVFGHKPTYGLVPTRGQTLPGVQRTTDLSVCGPLARTAADLDLALSVLAGPDREQANGYHLALPLPRHAALTGYRVLIVDRHPLVPTAQVVRDAIANVAARLAALGAEVGRSNEHLPDLADAGRVYLQLLGAETNNRAPAEQRQRMAEIASALAPDDDSLDAIRARNVNLSHRDWVALDERRVRIRGQWRRLFEDWDVVLSPPLSTVAYPHMLEGEHATQRIRIDNQDVLLIDQLVWPGIATMAGLPATVAPVGRTQEGLPIGVQIMGAAFDDRTTIAFAGHLERAFGGFVPPPGFA